MDYFFVLEGIAMQGIKNQKVNEGDYYNHQGLLICGTCGEPRQCFQSLAHPLPGNKDNKSLLKHTCACKCERDRKAKEAQEEKAKAELSQLNSLKKASLMDSKFASATFDKFVTTPENERNLKLCKRYATAFEEMLQKGQGLLMWGDTGTGKSFASACIANYLLERKTSVIMTSFVKLLEILEKGHEDSSELISRLNLVKLVIFDDLGAERCTDYAIEKVYNLIDSRYRSGLPMIITTNLTLPAMQRETDIRYSRIYDRIFETCYPMQFTGQSWRKKTAYNKFKDMERILDIDN